MTVALTISPFAFVAKVPKKPVPLPLMIDSQDQHEPKEPSVWRSPSTYLVPFLRIKRYPIPLTSKISQELRRKKMFQPVVFHA